MKKFLLILSLCIATLPIMAEDEVYLDLNASDMHQFKTFSPDLQNQKTEKEKEEVFDTDMILHPFKSIAKEYMEMYSEAKQSQH